MTQQEQTVQAVIETTPARLREIADLPGVRVHDGEWGEDGGFVAYDEGPLVLEAIGKVIGGSAPDWMGLSEIERRGVLLIAAESRQWRSHGELYDYRVHEILDDLPELRDKF